MNLGDGNFELREIQTLRGHTDRVWSLAWNPTTGVDGVPAVIASCGADKTVRIWEQIPATDSFYCKSVLQQQHTMTVRWCVWSPSGKLLATSNFDGTIDIWENVGGNFDCVYSLQGPDTIASSVSWNPSGSYLVTCVPRKRIWIWEVLSNNKFEVVALVLDNVENVKMVQWHPSMDILFSSSFDNTINVWVEDVDTGDWYCVQTLGESNSGRTYTVQALAFNASADKMVSCSDDLTIRIWGADIARMLSEGKYTPWTCLCTLSGYHDRTIFSIHWSREGIICSGAGDKAICFLVESEDGLVDKPTYKLLLKKEKAHDMDINAVQWSPTGNRHLASASDDGTVKIWELASSPS